MWSTGSWRADYDATSFAKLVGYARERDNDMFYQQTARYILLFRFLPSTRGSDKGESVPAVYRACDVITLCLFMQRPVDLQACCEGFS